MLLLLFLSFCSLCQWFIIEIFAKQYRREDNPAKRSMYLRLGVLFLPWMALPPLVSLAVFALDPWVRERIVQMFTVGISTLAYAVLVFLFWPSRAEEVREKKKQRARGTLRADFG